MFDRIYKETYHNYMLDTHALSRKQPNENMANIQVIYRNKVIDTIYVDPFDGELIKKHPSALIRTFDIVSGNDTLKHVTLEPGLKLYVDPATGKIYKLHSELLNPMNVVTTPIREIRIP